MCFINIYGISYHTFLSSDIVFAMYQYFELCWHQRTLNLNQTQQGSCTHSLPCVFEVLTVWPAMLTANDLWPLQKTMAFVHFAVDTTHPQMRSVQISMTYIKNNKVLALIHAHIKYDTWETMFTSFYTLTSADLWHSQKATGFMYATHWYSYCVIIQVSVLEILDSHIFKFLSLLNSLTFDLHQKNSILVLNVWGIHIYQVWYCTTASQRIIAISWQRYARVHCCFDELTAA